MPRLHAVLRLLWLAVLACVVLVTCAIIGRVSLFPVEWAEWVMERFLYAHARVREANLQAFWDRWNR